MKDSVVIKRIWQFAKPYKWSFLGSYSILLVELALLQAMPLFLEKVITAVIAVLQEKQPGCGCQESLEVWTRPDICSIGFTLTWNVSPSALHV